MDEIDGRQGAKARRSVTLARLLLLATFVVVGAAPACADESSTPSAADLAAVADSMDWPRGDVPEGDLLVRYAQSSGGSGDADIDVGRANVCAWYERWWADYLADREIDPEVLAYLERHLPDLPYLEGVSGGTEALALMAQQAAAGEVEPIETYLDLNHCEILGARVPR